MRGRVFVLLLVMVGVTGCRVHNVGRFEFPGVCVPNDYLQTHPQEEEVVSRWWEEFEEPVLNCLVETGLQNNLDVAQAWNRLSQARAQAVIEGADRYPKIDMTLAAINTSGSGQGGIAEVVPGTPIAEVAPANGSRTLYLMSFDFAYEIDLWKRIDSKTKAGCFDMFATYEDLQATALVITGSVTDLWLTIQEQLALLKLFATQIEVNKTLLELVELRFSIGEASALDVYQQRLQLAETETQVTPVKALLQTTSNQLYTLLGQSPGELIEKQTTILDRDLPEFPFLGRPADLLRYRPDVKAVQQRLRASDFRVAEAVADRFPKLTSVFSYDFSAFKFRDIFNQELISLAGNLVTPLVDGYRRRAEVDKRKAIVCERLNEFGEVFLTAVREVEDAISNEKYQIEFLKQLKKQEELAKANLREARIRYMNGLSDYLPVIAAIQSLQNVQRRIITERKDLLAIRSKLYLALGGMPLGSCS